LVGLTGIIVTFNIFILLGLLIYSVRLRRMFSSWNYASKGLSLLVGSAVFLLLAACIRWGLEWEFIPSYLDSLEVGLRSVAFVLLFAFAVRYVRAWKKG
jgi:hypothetical protein